MSGVQNFIEPSIDFLFKSIFKRIALYNVSQLHDIQMTLCFLIDFISYRGNKQYRYTVI